MRTQKASCSLPSCDVLTAGIMHLALFGWSRPPRVPAGRAKGHKALDTSWFMLLYAIRILR